MNLLNGFWHVKIIWNIFKHYKLIGGDSVNKRKKLKNKRDLHSYPQITFKESKLFSEIFKIMNWIHFLYNSLVQYVKNN